MDVVRRYALLPIALGALGCALAGCGGDTAARSQQAERPQLVLAGDGELWIVDVLGARAKHVALKQLAPGDPPLRVLARGAEVALWGYDIFSLDPKRTREPPRPILRDGWFFIASADPHRLWVAMLDRRSPATVRRLRAVREISIDGSVTVADTHPPHGYWPQLAVRDGLLFAGRDGGSYVWNPRTRRVTRRWAAGLGQPGAAHRDLIASCPGTCAALLLTNVRTGAQRRVPAPRGWTLDVLGAEFAPDGRTLAVPLQRGSYETGVSQLGLVDVARRRMRVANGSTVPSGYTFARWSRGGGYAFLTGGSRRRRRTIVAYRLGSTRAHKLRVWVGDFYGAAGV